MMKLRKMHNRIVLFAALLMCAALFLYGCGGDTSAKRRDGKSGSLAATLTPTPSPTSTPSPTPTPMREPDDYKVAELYEAVTDIPNLYRLPIAENMDGREFQSLKVSGNYVLAYFFPVSDGEIVDFQRPGCVLFHLGRPDLTRIYETSKKEQGYAQWEVLSDGTTLKYNDELGTVTVFDRELEKKNEFRYAGKIVESTEIGLFWTYQRKTGELAAYDVDSGEKKEEYSLVSLDFEAVTELSDTVNGVRYFQGYNPDGAWMVVAVTQATGEADTVPVNHDNPTYLSDYFSYRSATKWFLQPVYAPHTMISFEKGNRHEMLHTQKGSLLAASCRSDSGEPDNSGMKYEYTELAVYDVGTRQRYVRDVRELASNEGADDINLFWFSDHGEVILCDYDELGSHVFLWNYKEEESAAIAGYCEYGDSGMDTLVADRIAAIREKFDVVVHYKKEQLSSNIFDYYMEPITDEIELMSMIEEVWEFLAMYPDGFWGEIPGKEKEGIDFYICKEFIRRNNTMIENAAAVVNISWPTICMGVCSKYKSQMRETLVHETMHMMEQRLEEYAKEQDINPLGYWFEKLNTSQYPYHYAYTDEKGNSIEDPRGTAKGDKPSEAWFIDAYSRTFYKEDRARIIENLYLGNAYYFKNSKHLRDKAEFLCAMIRAAFPSVAACKEPVFWEVPLGIIDPEPYLEMLRTY